MALFDAFRYDGKRALVVGGATGMGAATAELLLDLGAEVVVMDYAEITQAGVTAIHVNLTDKDSMDKAIAECGGKVDALFSCAGVDEGTPNIEKVNFLGHRHMIERMLDNGMLGRGSRIAFISSAAGLGWETNLDKWKDLIATPDFESGVKWVEVNGGADYMSMKQAICTYVAFKAFPLLKQGIRINATCPGPTDTPLARANPDMWLGFGSDYRGEVGVEPSTPLEQAYALAFLNSDAAASISGITMITDMGYMSSGITGSFPDATMIANLLLNRPGALEALEALAPEPPAS
jgi:NAD(P)-dependent dehydrogenase (short-subunit alcohol dehydrogenase family)